MAARKNGIHIDYSAFSDLIEQLERFEADVPKIVAESMEEAGETLAEETIEALASANLPASGKYSQGDTVASVVKAPKAETQGSYIEIGLGFDKTKSGAGGFLVTGTPKMRPDYKLEAIYGSRKYETKMKNQIKKKLNEELSAKMGG